MRELADEGGRRWRVWEVHPNPGLPPNGVERRAKPRVTVSAELRGGWLVFESALGDERFRLAPAPHGWRELPDDQLIALRHRGTRVTARRRLIE